MRALFSLWLILLAGPALAAGDAKHPHGPAHGFAHTSLFGTYDRAALQRGFQVYKEVCSACHALSLLSYRNLRALGFSEDEVKAIAGQYTVTDGPNDEGMMFERPATPADRFISPFANEKAARFANNGAYPVDLSLVVKARAGGEDYIYSLLTGYTEPPPSLKLMEGMNYNPYFPGGQIAMSPPLVDGAITFADGTAATISQQASDVTTFLAWAAEPKLEERKRTGVMVILFLLAFAGIMYVAKRRVWRGVPH